MEENYSKKAYNILILAYVIILAHIRAYHNINREFQLLIVKESRNV